jgi:hypothetical protein
MVRVNECAQLDLMKEELEAEMPYWVCDSLKEDLNMYYTTT